MKSALSIVAFSNATRLEGAVALLETALIGLDSVEERLAAAYVEHALAILANDIDERRDRNLHGILPHQ